jgi:protoporphyrinogen oxidase
MSEHALVVGGGPVGLVTSLLARLRGAQVTLLEGGAACGGLMRTSAKLGPHCFDHGTRFAPLIGVREADDAVFGREAVNWIRWEQLEAGTYFAGHRMETTGFLSDAGLSNEQRGAVWADYLRARPNGGPYANAAVWADDQFGREVRSRLLEPAVRKVTGQCMEWLAAGTPGTFGLSRLALFDAETTRALKRDPVHDARLAYHDRDERPRGWVARPQLYPSSGGMTRWVDAMLQALSERHVRIETSAAVQRVEATDGSVRVVDATGRGWEGDIVYWALPMERLVASCDGVRFEAMEPSNVRGSLRRIRLLHGLVDRPYRTSLHYVTDYDPSHLVYRIALYENYQPGRGSGVYRFTAEVLDAGEEDAGALLRRVLREVGEVGVLDPDGGLVAHEWGSVPGGFVVHSPASEAQQLALRAEVERALPRVRLCSSGAPGRFHLRDLIAECVAGVGAADP